MRLKKGIGILIGVVLLALVLGPATYSYVKEKMYYENQLFTIISFAEVTILDKFMEDENYYLEFTIDNEHYIDKYKINDCHRIYQLADKELYEQVDLSRTDDSIGLTIESEVDKNKVSNHEIRNFELDPFLVLSKQEYSKYIEIVDILQR
ncbi:hypothetical protein [Alkalibacillus haloalkaliphilus]|uniref:Uncharacterized protein n=1 Tax=Alkalibacillus haloalkaliphilus TaxID=94136 RepID=A0A511W181_9BACI|nr:hypothetical protein [Alkalibacillus haloalkaliphilus]GEN44850.1 hypothetical protein AHA02nite_06260 [Alkalibacillus haloalkaliphilus]